jgi:hypothetical protein
VRGPERLEGWRVVARPDALDALEPAPGQAIALRLAPDDLLVLGLTEAPRIDDPDAIVVAERGYVGWTLDETERAALLRHHVEWEPGPDRPALAQGLIAGVPAKLWLDERSALLLCPAAYAAEMEARIA